MKRVSYLISLRKYNLGNNRKYNLGETFVKKKSIFLTFQGKKKQKKNSTTLIFTENLHP